MKKLERWQWGIIVQFFLVLIATQVFPRLYEPGERMYNFGLLLTMAMPISWFLIAAIVLLRLGPEERFDTISSNRMVDEFIGTTFMVALLSWMFIFICAHSKAIINGADALGWGLVNLFAIGILDWVYHIRTGIKRKAEENQRFGPDNPT